MSYDALAAALRQDHAALALFDVREKSSEVFVVDPAEPEPAYRPVDLTSAELADLMPSYEDLAYAKPQVFAAVTALSGKLLPTLTDVIKRYQILYLIPTSALVGRRPRGTKGIRPSTGNWLVMASG